MSAPESPRDLNAQAERDVVSMLLAFPSHFCEVSDLLEPDDFGTPLMRRVFGAMLDLYEQSDPITTAGVGELIELETGRSLTRPQAEELISLVTEATSAAMLSTHARTVLEHGTRRRAGSLTEEATGRLRALPLGMRARHLEQGLADFADEILQLRRRLAPKGRVETTAKGLIESLKANLDAEVSSEGIPTGLSEIDKILGGYRSTELTVIGARPSVGKSAMLLQLSLSLAARRWSRSGVQDDARRVLYVSVEMGAEQVGIRVLSNLANVNSRSILEGRLTTEERDRVEECWASNPVATVTFMEQIRARPQDVRSAALRVQEEHGLDVVVVDYLQRMRVPRRKNQARYEIVGEVAAELKELARELDVHVITAAQLSRDSQDREPMLSDLRESGDIEQEADNVGLLWQPKDDDNRKIDGRLDLIWAKQRQGPTGVSELRFDPSRSSMADASPIESHSISFSGD
jgi:replicative DNA helicase